MHSDLGTRGKSRRLARALAVLSAVAVTAGLAPTPVAVADEGAAEFDEQVLFDRSTDEYECFRIPAIVKTTEDTLLAFAEGRKNDCGDDGDIDTVVRRSTDGGETWGPVQVVHAGDGDTVGNPSPVVDAVSGRIALITTHNPGDYDHARTPFLQYSEDDGLTWSEPENIADDASDPAWDYWLATGPGHGIQLERGDHAGRMLIGVNHEGEDGVLRGAHLIYSDDGGLSWQRGAIDQRRDTTLKPQEMSLVELTDGRIYVAARDTEGTESGHRAFAVSSDGGFTFDEPFTTVPELVAPIIQAPVLRYEATDEGAEQDRILFASPVHPASREAMAVRSSYDEGQSWETWQEGRIIHWGPTAYSDMVGLDDGFVGLLYEAGESSAYEEIRFARFNEAFMDSPNPEAPGTTVHPPSRVTPDKSAAKNLAFVRDDAHVVDGVIDGALELDGITHAWPYDDRVDVPYSDAIDLDDGDFTVSAWIRYGEHQHQQSIFWAYLQGEGPTPGIWLRAEPSSNRIRAFLGAESGTKTVQSAEAYDDGEWHLVTFRRDGDAIDLWVDGEKADAAEGPTGSITEGRELRIDGFFIGQRLDGRNPFGGAIDDVRVYDRALSAEEISAMAGAPSDEQSDDALILHLPFDEVNSYVDPSSGPAAGGTEVTIYGQGFNGATEVAFGGVTGADVSVINDESLTVTTPPNDPGEVEVIVKGDDFESEPGKFEYVGDAPDPGAISAKSAGTKLVGNATNVWGDAEGLAGETAVAEALVDGEWVEVGSATVADDDSYVIELSGDAVASAGEYTLRVRVGETVSEEFSFERVARTGFGAANFAPTGREANVWGTVDGSAKVSTQVYVPGRGWSTSQVAETDANGWFAIPLTYGANSAGEYRWRVVVEHEHGEREFLREFTQTRVAGPSATTAGSAPTGREANVWGTATPDASVWTEVYLGADRGWSKSQQTTANSSGGYVIPLTYGHDVGGTYRFRVATQVPEVGVLFSDEFSFVRTVR